MTQAYYHISPIDENFDQLKKSFNPLVLLSQPSVNTVDYTRIMEANKISELDDFIKEKSDIFIKGKQYTLKDVLHLLSNLITFSRFWTGCTID